jgi:tetratricopeptide (TPR) repeat protein
MGVQLARSNEYEKAWENFTAAIRADSALAAAWGNLGLLERGAGREEPALSATRRAEELDPKDESYAQQEGDILRDRRRYEDAAVAYRRALALRPGDSKTLLALAECLGRSGDLEGAAAALEQAKRVGAPREEAQPVQRVLPTWR